MWEIPRYRNRTLLKDILESNQNLIDFTYPALEGMTDETATDIKHYLYDSLIGYYKYSEIGTYYAYEFKDRFSNRWNTTITKYVPLIKSKLHTEDNINTGEDFTSEKNSTTEDSAGKKETRSLTRSENGKITFGKTIDNDTTNTSEITNHDTESGGDTTRQFERQITNNTSENVIDTHHNSEQTGSYDTKYGGSDTNENSRNDSETVEHSGADTLTENGTSTYKRTIYDYGRIKAIADMPNIVDEFIGEFANLFVEVFM